MKAKRENFYRRSPDDALAGMVGMTLEERGAYNTIIDLIYLTWRPLEDNRRYIANHCDCAVQKLNPIIERLIARGKLLRFQEGGVWYLSNRRFEDERTEIKGASKTRSGRGEVGEKSAGVEEKSAGVSENSLLLEAETAQIQEVAPLERQERLEKKDIVFGENPKTRTRQRKAYPPEFEAAWSAYPHTPGRSSKTDALAEWERLPDDERGALLKAIAAFRPAVAEVCGGKGAPCMARWLKHAKHLNFIPSGGLFDAADPTATWGDAQWSVALRIWRDSGDWPAEFGPKPGAPGCRAPARLLVAPATSATG